MEAAADDSAASLFSRRPVRRPNDGRTVPGLLEGTEWKAASASHQRSDVGLVDTQADGGPRVVTSAPTLGLTVDPMIANAAGHPELEGQNVSDKDFKALIETVNAKTRLVGTTKTGQEIREDSAGNLVKIPVTSTSRPNLPTGPASNIIQNRAAQPTPGGAPASGFPRPGTAAPSASGGTIIGQGKSAADVGVAFNPQTGENVQTTRSEAAQQGLQNFSKTSEPELNKYRQAQAQFNDVQTNTSRYTAAANNAASKGLSAADLANISSIMNDKGLYDFNVAISGGGHVDLPLLGSVSEAASRIKRSAAYRQLSPQAKDLVDGYFRTMASVPAYMKALTGVGRFNKEIVDLELRNIPNPTMAPQDIQRKLGQWQENIDQGASSIPRMKGIPNTKDIRQKYETSAPSSTQQPVDFSMPQPFKLFGGGNQ